MAKRVKTPLRREEALTRERIIQASIELLDNSGEEGLTFRTLSERLSTGPGALYWHVANKTDLLTASCDAVVAQAIDGIPTTSPEETIRAVAFGLFDVIDDHPWIGSALTSAPGQLPTIRVLERIGQQVCELGVPDQQQWAAINALMGYILGVSQQNAANRQLARIQKLDRSNFLDGVATAWLRLDPATYPFTRSLASHIRDHNDRADFLAGLDLILKGINPPAPPPRPRRNGASNPA